MRLSLSRNVAFLAVLVVLGFSGTPVRATAPKTIKLATLAPNGSSWMRHFNEWGRDVQDQTHGAVRLRFYPGGVAGDERDVIRKMQTGQMHGASVTSIGLSQIHKPVLVLQVPGLFADYVALDRARDALKAEFARAFERNNYVLIGWGDVGPIHTFSKRQIRTPADLKRARPWVWSDDPITRELYSVLGVTGVPLGLPEVYAGLQTGMIDTFTASPIAVLALQWQSNITHMTEEHEAMAIGATVISKRFFDTLTAEEQRIVRDTGAEHHRRLIAAIRRDDAAALTTLKHRGLTVDSIPPAARAEWQRAFAETRRRLAPRIYSAELLARVERLAAGN